MFQSYGVEAESVSDEVVDKWTKERLPRILDGWHPKDAYNCDETGLFSNAAEQNNSLERW